MIEDDHDLAKREVEGDLRVISVGQVTKEVGLVSESFVTVRIDSTEYRNLERFTAAVITK